MLLFFLFKKQQEKQKLQPVAAADVPESVQKAVAQQNLMPAARKQPAQPKVHTISLAPKTFKV